MERLKTHNRDISGLNLQNDQEKKRMKIRKNLFVFLFTAVMFSAGAIAAGEPWPYSVRPLYGEKLPFEDDSAIFLSTVCFSIHDDSEPEMPAELLCTGKAGEEEEWLLVHIEKPWEESWLSEVRRTGAETTRLRIPNYFYIVKVSSEEQVTALRNLEFVDWTGRYHPAYKISPNLMGLPDAHIPRDAEGRGEVYVEFFPGVSEAEAGEIASELNAEIFDCFDFGSDGLSMGLYVPQPESLIIVLSKRGKVRYISPRPKIKKFEGLSAAGIIQSAGGDDDDITDGTVNTDDYPVWMEHGIHGQHQAIAISDSGIDYNHAYFRPPVNPLITTPDYTLKVPYADLAGGVLCDEYDGHGTSVAAAAAQDGNADDASIFTLYHSAGYYGDALAHEAQIFFGPNNGFSGFNFTDQYNQWNNLLDMGACVLNTSWSWGSPGSPPEDYTNQARLYDYTIRYNEECMITNACGNDGSCASMADYQDPNYSKSPIDVGASDDLDDLDDMYNGWWASNRGPNATGNSQMPDVVAPGSDSNHSGLRLNKADGVCEGFFNSQVCSVGGTSFAAPIVAGAVALIHQYFEEGYYPSGTQITEDSLDPSGALLKAMIINSARRMIGICTGFGDRPGDDQGWGRPTLDDVMFFEGDTRKICVKDILNADGFTASGQEHEYQYYVSSSDEPLKITLCWTDYYGIIGTTGSVVRNDLNLTVAAPDETEYIGNKFQYGWSTTGGIYDDVNTVECVYLDEPEPGVYTVNVNCADLNAFTQGYALVVSGDVSDELPPPIPATSPWSALLLLVIPGFLLSLWRKSRVDV